MPTAPPPDLGLGKVMAIAGSLLVAVQLTRAVRSWWGRRWRAKQRDQLGRAGQIAEAQAKPLDAGHRARD